MTGTEPRANALRRGFGLGTLVVLSVVVVAALAPGADLWVAVLVGVFVGLFVGGGPGLLISARPGESD